VLAISLFFIFGAGFLNETFSSTSQYIQVPAFGYYECAPSGVAVASPLNNIPSTGSGFVTCPKNSAECNIQIRVPVTSWGSNLISDYKVVTQICDIESGACQQQNIMPVNTYGKNSGDGYYTLNNIPLLVSQKIWIDYQKKTLFSTTGLSGSQYKFNYIPFIIWKNGIFNIGGRTPLTTVKEGCEFGTYGINTNNFLISETLSQVNIQQTTLSNTVLQPYQTRGFVENFIPISVENRRFVIDGYCSNNAIYKIDTVKTNSGTYKVVRQDMTPIRSVTCCPGDTDGVRVCKSDFNWSVITATSTVECSAFNPCPILFWTEGSTPGNLVKQTCQNSKCVPETKTVECTRNSMCQTGQSCDMISYTCINNPGGTILESNTSTTATQCEQKAKAAPLAGWVWKESTTTSCGMNPFCWAGITSPKVTTTGECKASFVIYWILGAIIIVLALIFFLVPSKHKRRR
jgi:hypothetical protein